MSNQSINSNLQLCTFKICFLTLEWLLVSEKKECGGSEFHIGALSTIDECSKSCYGRSSMFAFGTNDYGTIRCWENGCSCYCETAASSEGTCSQSNHNGYRLYKYKTTGNFYTSFLCKQFKIL